MFPYKNCGEPIANHFSYILGNLGVQFSIINVIWGDHIWDSEYYKVYSMPFSTLEYYDVQVWESRFALRLNAAKNTDYIKKMLPIKVAQNKVSYKKTQ